jgi:putative CocE/NonD family hydrolase
MSFALWIPTLKRFLQFFHGVSMGRPARVSFLNQRTLYTNLTCLLTDTGKQSLDLFPWRLGIHRSWTSGLEKWEAPDPAEWIQRGYAVVNTDARGTFKSEGDMPVYGTQEGRDGHDAIEWIGTQVWCNGAVGMAGNSWLGSTQW